MATKVTEVVWLNALDLCSFEHVLEVSGLTESELQDLVDMGLIHPTGTDPKRYYFHTESIVIARRARRLRDDFELDAQGVAVALSLLERIEGLEAQLADLRARLATPRRR